MLAKKFRTALATTVAIPLFAVAAPAMGQVVNAGDLQDSYDSAGNPGQIVITNPNASTANVSVLAPVVVANWNQFNVPSNTTLNVSNASTAARASLLNRVIGGSFSNISGTINAAGVNLWLINQNGILFGDTASVSASSFFASTADVSDADFFDFYEGTDLAGNGSGTVRFQTNPFATTFIGAFGGATSSPRFVTDGTLLFVGPALNLTGSFNAGTGKASFIAATDVDVTFNAGSPVGYTITAGTTVADQLIDGSITGNSADFVFALQSSTGVLNGLLTVDADVATNAVSTDRGIYLFTTGDIPASVTVGGAWTSSGGIEADVNGDLTLSQNANGSYANLQATGDIATQGVTASSFGIDINSTGGGNVNLGNLSASTTIDVDTSGTVAFGSAVSGGAFAIGGSVDPSIITASGNVIAGSVNFDSTGALTAQNITATAGSIDIDTASTKAGALSATGAISVDGAGAVELTSAIADSDGNNNGALVIGGAAIPSTLTISGAAKGVAAVLRASGAVQLGSVSSTGGIVDIDSFTSSISAGAVSANGGDARLTAVNTVTTSSIASTAAIDVDSTARGNLNLGNLNAGTTINLDSGGAVAFGTANAGGAFVVGGTVNASSITASGNVVAGSVDFDANGNVAAQNVSSTAGDVTIDSTSGTIGAGLVSATGGSAILLARGSVTTGGLSATANVSARSTNGGAVSVGNISAGGSAALNTSGSVTAGSASVGGVYSIGATNTPNSVTLTGNSTAGSVRFRSSGLLSVQDVTATAGSIDVAGANVTGSDFSAPNNVVVNASNSVTLDSVTADSDGDSTGSALIGQGTTPVTLTINGPTSGASAFLRATTINVGNVTATAGGATVTGGTVTAGAVGATGGDAIVSSVNNLTTTSITSTTGAVDVDSTGGGNLNLGNLAAATTISVDTSGSAAFGSANAGGAFTIGGSVDPSSITASGNVTAGSIDFDSNGSMSLRAVSASSGALALNAAGAGSDITTQALSASGSTLLVSAGRNITTGSVAAANGTVGLHAGGTISTANVTAGTDLLAVAGSGFTGGQLVAGDDILVNAAGPIAVTGANTTGAGSDASAPAFVNAAGSSTLVFGAESYPSSNIRLVSTGGSISGGIIGMASIGGSVTLQAPGHVTTISVSSMGSIDIDSIAGGALDLGNLDATATIALDTAGTVRFGNVMVGAGLLNIGATTMPSAIATTGIINALTLSARTTGGIDFSGANRIMSLGTLTAGGPVVINSLVNLAVNGVVTASGQDVTLKTTGDITLGSGGRVIGKIVALSAEGNFINNRGADAIAASDHWVVYSNAPAGNTFGNLDSGNTAIWNATIATLAPTAVSGNRYVFAYQPTLTVSSTSVSKVYGTDLTGVLNGYYTVSGFQPGVAGAYLADTAANTLTGAPTVTSAGAAERADVAGSPYIVNVELGTLAASRGYAIALSDAGTLTVTPKPVSASVAANDKTYDGTTAGTGSISSSEFLSGDDVTITGTTYTFSDKNVGIDKTVAISSATLSGTDAGNYTLTVPTSTLADIFAKAIGATVVADDKTYDGTTAATGSLTLNGVVAGDDLGTSGTTFTFSDKNAGVDKTVTVSGTALTGADAGNYVLTVPATTLADIFARSIGATVTANDKTYDGTTAATGTLTLTGVLAGDDLGTSGTTFAFADKNAGTDKTVTVSGTTLTGTDAGNYVVTVPASTLADIFAKAISATVIANDKTYDGTTAATGSVSLVGVVAGDSVDTTGTTFTFSDKNVGTDKTVAIAGTTLTGTDAGNYTLTVSTSTLADIFVKAISATVAVNDKTYDGTTAATGSVALVGVVSGDSVATSGTTFTFADKNAGIDKTVTIGGTTLTGADAGNYTVSVPTSAMADILARAITATATANDKIYDGTTAATGALTLNGVVAGDSVNTTGTAFAFADKNAGTGKVVTASGAKLTGADAGNYTLTGTATALADILAKAITGSANVNDKVYDGTTAATGTITLTGIVAGDAVSTTGTTFTFVDPNAGTDKTVRVGGTALAGADSGNYTLTLPATALADILKRAIEIVAVDGSKSLGQVDPALAFTVGGAGLVAGDSLTGVLQRVPGEIVGNYTIGQGSLTAGANYTITFTGGTFTVRPTPVPNTLRTTQLPSELDGLHGGSGVTIEVSELCPEGDQYCAL